MDGRLYIILVFSVLFSFSVHAFGVDDEYSYALSPHLLNYDDPFTMYEATHDELFHENISRPSFFPEMSRQFSPQVNKPSQEYQGYIIELEAPPLVVARLQAEKFEEGIRGTATVESFDENAYLATLENQRTTVLQEVTSLLHPSDSEGRFGAMAVSEPVVPRFTYQTVFNGFSLDITDEQAKAIAQLDGVKRVSKNYIVHTNVYMSVPFLQNGVSAGQLDEDGNDCTVTEKPCLTGAGVTIAILDTGVDYTHNAFGACTQQEFLDGNCAKVIGGYDFINDNNDPMDDNSHGTHVAGIAAGNETDLVMGVAPDAKILAYKVLNKNGSGGVNEILGGIDAAVNDGADILSLSLGYLGGNPLDEFSQALDNAVLDGRVVVVAAGNSGPRLHTIASPGVAQKVITVGSIDFNDNMAHTSSRGPVTWTEDSNEKIIIKPDVVAPGVNIYSSIPLDIAFLKTGDPWEAQSGTSMAAPHVSGAVALLLEKHPNWNPEEIKSSLKASAISLPHSPYAQGAGKINISYLVSLDHPLNWTDFYLTNPYSHAYFEIIEDKIIPIRDIYFNDSFIEVFDTPEITYTRLGESDTKTNGVILDGTNYILGYLNMSQLDIFAGAYVFNISFTKGFEYYSKELVLNFFNTEILNVSTCTQLQNITNSLVDSLTHYKINITNDIDCSETYNWNCNGEECEGFSPLNQNNYTTNSVVHSIQGNGYTISNLYINRPNQDYVGIFSEFKGDIVNLNLLNVNITGFEATGGFAGLHKDGIIENISVSGFYDGRCVGSLVGATISSHIRHIDFNSQIDVFRWWGGGLIGCGYFSLVENVTGISNISTEYATVVGGLIGDSYNNTLVNINITTTINNIGFNTGGLTGTSMLDAITNVSINATIYGSTDTFSRSISGLTSILIDSSVQNAAISGDLYTNTSAAGLTSRAINSTINNSYFTGNIFNANAVAGLIGRFESGELLNSYTRFNVTSNGLIWFEPLVVDLWHSSKIDNSYYNKENIYVNEQNNVTGFGVLNSTLFEEWITNDKSLDIHNYFTESGGVFQVNTAADLQRMKYFGYANASFALTSNIDLSSENSFYIPYFTGSFEGNNNSINNIQFHTQNKTSLGFFGFVRDSYIQNLVLENVSISNNFEGGDLTQYSTGGFLGYIAHSNLSNINMTGTVLGTGLTGGLIGYKYNTTAKYIHVLANVSSLGSRTGGIIGYQFLGGIISSNFSGMINSTSHTVGGVIGFSGGTNFNLSATSTINGSQIVGGLVGLLYLDSVVDSYAYSQITCINRCGGLIGDSFSRVDGYYDANGNIVTYLPFNITNSYYDYESTLINNQNVISLGAMPHELFNDWILNNKQLEIDTYFTEEDGYYVIETISDLQNILGFSNGNSFLLKENIDLQTIPGFYIPYFSGIFEGNNKIISNLYINTSTSNVGLFGIVNEAHVSNLSLKNSSVKSFNYAGGLLGYSVNSNLHNITVKNVNVSSEGSFFGGVASIFVSSNISQISATGVVEKTIPSLTTRIGGFAGEVLLSHINNSFSHVNINGLADNSVRGGLIGLFYLDSTIENSYSTGEVLPFVEGQERGFVGRVMGSVSVQDSFWDMETSGWETSVMGEGKTTQEMKNISTFTDAGWDFDTVWGMDENYNNGYPYLLSQVFSELYVESPTGTQESNAVLLSLNEDYPFDSQWYTIYIQTMSNDWPYPLVWLNVTEEEILYDEPTEYILKDGDYLVSVWANDTDGTIYHNNFTFTIDTTITKDMINLDDYYSYSDVLLVCNEDSAISQEICSYFVQQRLSLGFNPAHIVNLTNVATDETTTHEEYEKILSQIQATLDSLESEINYIVTTKGVPLRTGLGFDCHRTSGDYPENCRSIDSKLMSDLGSLSNYFEREDIFSHERYGGYLITRLTGYDADDAKRLIDLADSAEIAGYVLLNNYSSTYPMDAYMTTASEILTDMGITTDLQSSEFIRNRDDLIGYYSWGSNAGCGIDCRNSSTWNFSFNPGAIGETIVSTSARTFNVHPYDGSGLYGGQSLIVDLIKYNITGVKGYVHEPSAMAVARAHIVFPRYFSGYTLADSFYMASPLRDWMDVVVGDPKAHIIRIAQDEDEPIINLTTIPDNQTLTYGQLWEGVQFEVESSQPIDTFWVNDTTNFVINQSGFLNWTTPLNVNNYYVIVSVNDTSGNINATIFNLNITQRIIQITADNIHKTFNTADPALTYQITEGSLAYEDEFTGDLTRETGESVGTYNISQGTLSITNIENYNLTFVNGTFTITPATLIGSITGTTPIMYGTPADINADYTNDGDSDISYFLYRNDEQVSHSDTTLLGAGTYTYVFNATGGQNYTTNASIDTFTLVVNQNDSACTINFNETSPIAYPQTFRVWSDCMSEFTLYRNGTEIGNNSVQSLQAGIYNFTVQRTDTQNYSNVYDEALFEVLDTTPPSIVIHSPLNQFYNSSDIDLDVSADRDVVLWNYSLNNGDLISFVPNTTLYSLSDNSYELVVYAVDSFGFVVNASVDFIVDTTPPVSSGEIIAGTLGSSDWYISSVEYSINISDANEIHSTYYCIDSSNECLPATPYTIPVTLSADGIFYVRFFSVDASGNSEQVQSSGMIRIDQSLPLCGEWSPNPSSWKFAGNETFVLSGSTDAVSGINVSGGSCITSADHGATCTVTISDNAGNTYACTSPINRVDSNAPVLTVTNASSSWFNTPRSARITALDDASGLLEIRYSWSDDLSGVCDAGGSVISSDSVVTAPINGSTLYVCARDSVGNVATFSGDYNWDTSQPVCGEWSPDPSPWKAEGNETFVLSDSTDAVSGINVSGGSCTTSAVHGATCTLIISDNAGNTRTCVSPQNNVDSGAPDVGAPQLFSGNHFNNEFFTTPISFRSSVTSASELNESSCSVMLNGVSYPAVYNNGFCEYHSYTTPVNTTVVFSVENILGVVGSSSSGDFFYDSTPPTTLLSDSSSDWRLANVTVSVSCVDSGSGCNVTEYYISPGEISCDADFDSFEVYTSPIFIGCPSGSCVRTLCYRSSDNLENLESVNTQIYRIEKTLPSISVGNSSDEWFASSRGGYIDTITGESDINSIYYSWNTPLLNGCTEGISALPSDFISAPEGNSTLYICVRDGANQVAYWNGSYRWDATPPLLEIISPTASYYSNSSVLVNVSVSDNVAVSQVWYSFAGSNITYEEPLEVSFAEGVNTLYVWANDSVGNTNATLVTFTVDTSVPEVIIHSPSPDSIYSSPSIALNVSANKLISTWEYSLNDASRQPFVPNETISLSSGHYTLTVYATDALENEGNASVFFSVAHAPEISVSRNLNASILNYPINFSVNVTDLYGVDFVTVNDIPLEYSDPLWVGSIPASDTFVIYAENTTGSRNTTLSVSHYIDTIPPSVSAEFLVSGSSVDLSTWHTSPVDVELSAVDDFGISHIEYSLNSGSWVPYTSPFSVNHPSSVRVRAFDIAGNSALPKRYDVFVDTSSPTFTVLDTPSFVAPDGTFRFSLEINDITFPHTSALLSQIDLLNISIDVESGIESHEELSVTLLNASSLVLDYSIPVNASVGEFSWNITLTTPSMKTISHTESYVVTNQTPVIIPRYRNNSRIPSSLSVGTYTDLFHVYNIIFGESYYVLDGIEHPITTNALSISGNVSSLVFHLVGLVSNTTHHFTYIEDNTPPHITFNSIPSEQDAVTGSVLFNVSAYDNSDQRNNGIKELSLYDHTGNPIASSSFNFLSAEVDTLAYPSGVYDWSIRATDLQYNMNITHITVLINHSASTDVSVVNGLADFEPTSLRNALSRISGLNSSTVRVVVEPLHLQPNQFADNNTVKRILLYRINASTYSTATIHGSSLFSSSDAEHYILYDSEKDGSFSTRINLSEFSFDDSHTLTFMFQTETFSDFMFVEKYAHCSLNETLTSSCICQSDVYSSGYCCSYGHSSSVCSTSPPSPSEGSSSPGSPGGGSPSSPGSPSTNGDSPPPPVTPARTIQSNVVRDSDIPSSDTSQDPSDESSQETFDSGDVAPTVEKPSSFDTSFFSNWGNQLSTFITIALLALVLSFVGYIAVTQTTSAPSPHLFAKYNLVSIVPAQWTRYLLAQHRAGKSLNDLRPILLTRYSETLVNEIFLRYALENHVRVLLKNKTPLANIYAMYKDDHTYRNHIRTIFHNHCEKFEKENNIN